jgi:tetratricopeptide (TPR) repeat protein
VLAAASILLAVGVGVLATYLFREERPPLVAQPPEASAPASQLASVTIPKAPYSPRRDTPDLRGGGLASAFEHAMSAYERDDFTTAADQLEVVTRLESDHAQAHFYRGVSLLLLGRNGDAVSCLRQAVELTAGTQREASRYYLALAYLRNSQMQEALTELDAVIQMNGPHQAHAERLKQSLVTAR